MPPTAPLSYPAQNGTILLAEDMINPQIKQFNVHFIQNPLLLQKYKYGPADHYS